MPATLQPLLLMSIFLFTIGASLNNIDCNSPKVTCPRSCSSSLDSLISGCRFSAYVCRESLDWCANCLSCAFNACGRGAPQDYEIFSYCYY
ncbi:hypothetical protein BOX15_Mlig003746g1 [Macrostomum lignano]|uniref:Uncharacterized protein n=1 Tax=Macrostomum lignano TaxID=282301 RepID=A0A267ESC0_9PLAT|nr:hypothetical protein BOX15_Mlig003746g1 [Macrostomum lignano]